VPAAGASATPIILASRPLFWTSVYGGRYVPVADDVVVGVVASRHADDYKVDVGGSCLAQLDALAFDGASKRNKPNLQVGDVVYARVTLVRAFVRECVRACTCDAAAMRSEPSHRLGAYAVDVCG
jgi:exosome complex RNA-binding protein Rrp4